MTMSLVLHLYKAPVWRCALATIVAVPLSFVGIVGVVAVLGQRDINPAGVLMFFLCWPVLALPLAFTNCLLIAPCIAKMANGRRRAVGSHAALATAWFMLMLSGYLAIPRLPAEPNWLLTWLAICWYLATFLGPAVIAGSFVYSLKCNSMDRKVA